MEHPERKPRFETMAGLARTDYDVLVVKRNFRRSEPGPWFTESYRPVDVDTFLR